MIGGRTHIVVADSNVWGSRTLRDWLCMLHDSAPDLYTVVWSEDIRAETVRVVRRRHPEADGGMVAFVAERFTEVFPNGYRRDFSMDAPTPVDAGDWHVRALAEACGADLLVTDNVKDLLPRSDEEADALSHEVLTADAFFTLVDDSASWVVRATARQMRGYHVARARERRQEIDVDLPGALRRAGADQFAERVRQRLLEL